MDGTILCEVPHHKHLGLTLSDNMSWTPHINLICSQAGQRINILRKLSYRFNRRMIEMLYLAYVRPILEYASPIFSDQNISNDTKVENMQIQSAIVSTGALRNTNRSRLLDELRWNNPAERRHIACLSLKPQSHRAYDHITTLLQPKNVGIVGRS